MNNDLISREALKKTFENLASDDYNEPIWYQKTVFETIDNAPTVEPCYQTTSCLDCGNYDKENHNCPRYCEVIKEAINSRPQGDCISREALREDLRRFFPVEVLEGIEPKTLFAQIMHDIDNAPTVSEITKEKLSNAYDQGYEDGKNNWLQEERPQGKWIYPEKTDKEKGYGGYCSNCKCDMPIFVEDWKQKYCETKFCPNCGAKMKGGAE